MNICAPNARPQGWNRNGLQIFRSTAQPKTRIACQSVRTHHALRPCTPRGGEGRRRARERTHGRKARATGTRAMRVTTKYSTPSGKSAQVTLSGKRASVCMCSHTVCALVILPRTTTLTHMGAVTCSPHHLTPPFPAARVSLLARLNTTTHTVS